MGEISATVQDILDRAKGIYGSFASPDFAFVREAMDEQPYQAIADTLAGEFELEEDTDPNDDVSFGYVLSRSTEQWVLRVSMVGPYAVLLRIRRGGGGVPVELSRASEPEKRILEIVRQSGLRILTRPDLEVPVEMRLDNTEPANVRLYQVLFTDTDFLPWSL